MISLCVVVAIPHGDPPRREAFGRVGGVLVADADGERRRALREPGNVADTPEAHVAQPSDAVEEPLGERPLVLGDRVVRRG